MDENSSYALKDKSEVRRRMGLLDLPQNKQLREFVEGIRKERGDAYYIPYFDPCDGGTLARALFLLEAPGPKAVVSGFISRNNPDPSARNMCELLQNARIPRKDTLLWNVIPWYIGEDGKIRSASRADLMSTQLFLENLLKLLPKLKVIVLVGKKAQSKREQIADLSTATIYDMWHPSARVVNRWPEKKKEISAQLKLVAKKLAE